MFHFAATRTSVKQPIYWKKTLITQILSIFFTKKNWILTECDHKYSTHKSYDHLQGKSKHFNEKQCEKKYFVLFKEAFPSHEHNDYFVSKK